MIAILFWELISFLMANCKKCLNNIKSYHPYP